MVNFRIKSSESEVASEILAVKNGAQGIVTLTYDDGDISTAEFNADMFEKYDLYGTNFLIGRNLTSSVLPRMQAVIQRGRIDVASHGMYHDGGVYNPDATEQYYKEEIIDSKTMFENAFPSIDVIVFGPGDGRITDRGLEIVKENYYAQRKGTRGFGAVEPSEAELWDAKVKGIHDDTTLAGRNGWIDTVIENGQWLIELWHSIDAPGYMPQTKADAEAHYSYISQKQKEGKIWVASYTQAVKYMREKSVSESVAALVGDTVEVDLSYPASALPTDVFDYPLTVKVEVPSDWGSAQVSQNGRTKLISTYKDGDKTWANADIVPNGGIAALSKGVTGGKLESIMINGAAISGFDADQLSYTLETLNADLPVTVSAKPLDSDAVVTYAPSATVNETPATVTINVQDSDGVQQQYTLNFVKQLSGNNKLASLTVNGTPLAAFDPELTDYLVKTDKPEGGVTLAAVAEEAGAAVTYSANTITTLPQDVTITVTAENGAKKNYTLKLSDRNEDTVFAHDDFEAYTVGSNITSALWSTNNGTTNGTMGAVDPLDETNRVGKFYNLTGGTQNQQLNRYLGGINTEPVIVKGRYLNPNFSSGSFTEVIVRGNGTDGIVAAKFAANGDLVIGSSTAAGAKYAENEWVNYIFVIKPDTNRYSVTGYFYGDGARTASGEKAAVVTASGYTASNVKTDMARLDARILHKGSMTNGEGNIAYIDDIKIYSAGSFYIRMPETENINTIAGITVKANHDIDMTTVNSGSVALKNASGQAVELESAIAEGEETKLKQCPLCQTGVIRWR